MSHRLLAATVLVFGLSACGGAANLNPLGWFKSGGPKNVALIPEDGFLDSQDDRLLVSQVADFKVLQTSGGAILRVTGVTPRLGYWDAELVAENDEKPVNGVLTYAFKIAEPAYHTDPGRQKQREVLVAHFVSDIKLQGVTSIRILGINSSRSARR